MLGVLFCMLRQLPYHSCLKICDEELISGPLAPSPRLHTQSLLVSCGWGSSERLTLETGRSKRWATRQFQHVISLYIEADPDCLWARRPRKVISLLGMERYSTGIICLLSSCVLSGNHALGDVSAFPCRICFFAACLLLGWRVLRWVRCHRAGLALQLLSPDGNAYGR